MSSFEVTLADQRADESHPAFSNLFVGAEWQPHHQALVFARKPRLPTDKGLLAANFIAGIEPAGATARMQVDRRRWLGRNRDAEPSAGLVRRAAFGRGRRRRDATLDTGLDPVSAFSVRVQIAAKAKVRLTFCNAAADDRVDAARSDRQVPPARQRRARLADVGHADRHPAARDAHQRRELRRDPDPVDAARAVADAHPPARVRSDRRLRPAPALALRHLGRPADRAGLGRRRRKASACCARWRRRCASGRGAASPATWSSSTSSRRRT